MSLHNFQSFLIEKNINDGDSIDDLSRKKIADMPIFLRQDWYIQYRGFKINKKFDVLPAIG